MKQRLTKSIFAVAMTVFLASLIMITAAVYNSNLSAYSSNLGELTGYVAASIENNGVSFLEDIEHPFGSRVTVTSASGETLYNSGNGEYPRESISFSVLMSDGSFVTVYSDKPSLLSLIDSIFYPILALFILAIALSGVSAYLVSKWVIEPISSMNLEKLDDSYVYEELRPLVRRLKEQNRKIYEQMDELKNEHGRRDSMRREFTANVSHELKTPLTSISGYAEIIRDGVVSEEDVKPFAGKIYDEAQRMITLVGDILRLSELETKELSVYWEPVDVYEVCRGVMERLEPVAKAGGVSVEVLGKSLYITAVRTIIEEIAYNLCDNAIKYNRRGGGVSLIVSEHGESAVLTVRDTGIGIPQKDLDRVFERFYRVDKSHSREIGGTGLGLSIVKHSSSLHGARIEIDSEIGVGTRIDVIFTKRHEGES